MLSCFAFTSLSLSLLLSPPTHTRFDRLMNRRIYCATHNTHIFAFDYAKRNENELKKAKWKLMRVCNVCCGVNVVNQITNQHFIALNKRIQIDGRIDRWMDRLIDRTVYFPVPLIKRSSSQVNIGRSSSFKWKFIHFCNRCVDLTDLKRLQIRIQHLICTCFSSSFQQTSNLMYDQQVPKRISNYLNCSQMSGKK